MMQLVKLIMYVICADIQAAPSAHCLHTKPLSGVRMDSWMDLYRYDLLHQPRLRLGGIFMEYMIRLR